MTEDFGFSWLVGATHAMPSCPETCECKARPEVERAFNEAIDRALADITTGPAPHLVHGPPGSLVEDIYRAYEMVRDVTPPEPVKLTQAQFDALRAANPPLGGGVPVDGALSGLLGTPIELVESVEESTPHRERKRRLQQAFRDAARQAAWLPASTGGAKPLVAPVEPQVGWLQKRINRLFGRQA